MTAADHKAIVDALVEERQRLHSEIEANRRALVEALHAQGVAAGTRS